MRVVSECVTEFECVRVRVCGGGLVGLPTHVRVCLPYALLLCFCCLCFRFVLFVGVNTMRARARAFNSLTSPPSLHPVDVHLVRPTHWVHSRMQHYAVRPLFMIDVS